MEDSYNEYIEQLQKGSYEAVSELYSLYSNKLYSFVLAQTKNSTLSEDIVQETFLKLWKSRKQLDCYGNVHALIFTIARNLIIDSFRKQVSKISFDDYQQACNKLSSFPTPDEQVAYNEFVDRVQQTKKLLSKRACLIYEMSREKNMPINEIAESLNLSSQTVKNSLTSTLKLFKKNLSSIVILLLYYFS